MADGTHGLLVIKQAGGIAIVQDPSEALAPTMPLSAMNRVSVDYVLPVEEIGSVMTGLVMNAREKTSPDRHRKEQVTMVTPEHPEVDGIERAEALNGPPSPFTCPDCGGTLWEFNRGELVRYRCHVGHGFNADSLGEGQNGKVEEALWSALRLLEEAIELRKRMADRARERNLSAVVAGLNRDVADYEARAEVLRSLLLETPKRPIRLTRKRRGRKHGKKAR
jgi:two-component system chemotaxis response regulator CheB